MRPEDIALVEPGTGHVQGKIAVVEALGNTTFAHVDSPLGQINVEADAALRLEAGSAVGLKLDLNKVHVFGPDGRTLPRQA